jgi:hypothetical protein
VAAAGPAIPAQTWTISSEADPAAATQPASRIQHAPGKVSKRDEIAIYWYIVINSSQRRVIRASHQIVKYLKGIGQH